MQAETLSQQGRNGDTMLVHMAPSEVRSLQQLAMAHGGSLTINPTTGLPEAGFLKGILPMVLGAALTPLTGGLINPMTAGLLVGGGTAVATGDIKKGLMAGLGAYGGAGLAGGLMSAGTAAGAAGAGNAAAMSVPEAVPGFMGESVSAATNLGTAGQGISALGTEAGRSAFMSGVGGLGGLTKYGLAAASPLLGAMGEGKQPEIKQTPVMNKLEFQAQPVSPTPAPDVPGYGDLGRDFGRQQRYFNSRFVDTGQKFTPTIGIPTVTQMPTMANGGTATDAEITHGSIGIGNNTGYPLVDAPPTAYDTPAMRPQQMELLLNTPSAQYDLGTGQSRFAGGGISNLGGYSDGGRMLRGPGDGVSDSIPATIGDKQPARLADGEFVVPARIVSEIGNGSSEAGARKLYAMMDRVQKARKKSIGDGKVAVDSKAEKMLPA